MSDAFFSISVIVFKFLLFVFAVFLVFLIPFLLLIGVNIIILLVKGKRFKPRTLADTWVKPNIFRTLFVEFPQRVALDLFERDPDEFDMYGFWLFAGEQGSGKTTSMVWFMRMIKQRFPNCRLRSNIDITFQDDLLENGSELVFSDNDKWGQVEAIDEVQNWFNSSDSRNFPPELIQEICQQRKQHKMILGTSQRFNRVALPLRQQVNYLCLPITFAGCLTFLRVYKPSVSEDGRVTKQRFYKLYVFVHDQELRDSFDTRQKVKRMVNAGFVPRSEQLDAGIKFQSVSADNVNKPVLFGRCKK